MVTQHRLFGWRATAIAIPLVIFSLTQSSAKAIPAPNQSDFKLGQVGVGSRINRPTPLNLRPRTHIPLPTVRDRGYGSYYRHPKYRDRHRNGYGYRYGHDHYHTHRRRHRRRKGPVIIIDPANYSGYSNHNGYIRIIGK